MGDNDSHEEREEMWTTTQVAAYCGVRVGTISSYRSRGKMPAPDVTYGTRLHLWRAERIIMWRNELRR